MNTIYGVFIIESLLADDHYDGVVLEDILRMSAVEVQYHPVDTKEELQIAIDTFESTAFRYLHVSCHANLKGIKLSNDFIKNQDFSDMLKGKILDKRIFFSACFGGNRDLASLLIRDGAFSVIGSPDTISSDKAALLWASFYHVVHELENTSMRRLEIKKALRACTALFRIPIYYYSFIEDSRDKYMKRSRFIPSKNLDTKTLKL